MRAGKLAVALAVVMAGCSADDTAAPPKKGTDDNYWSECPDAPVYDRNLDLVTETGLESPSAAVLAVAPDGTEIGQVTMDAEAMSADVDVRLGDDTGVFHVSRRPSGWLVKGGEGCAAWPAGADVIGPPPDCDTEAYCEERFVLE